MSDDAAAMAPIPIRRHDPSAYDPAVIEVAFEAWLLLGDRNAAATCRLLPDLLPEGARVPDERTVRLWARQKGWDQEGDRRVAELFPALRRRNVARMAAMEGHAVGVYADTVAGAFADAKVQAVRVQAANAVAAITGLHRRDDPRTPDPAPPVPDGDAPSTPAELAASLRRMMDRGR